VKGDEADRAQYISAASLVLMGVVLVVFLVVGRFQSTAVTEPLGLLTAALERMRQGDFSQRINLPRARTSPPGLTRSNSGADPMASPRRGSYGGE
jgi:nitrate/nitrite-specific signal transduction histidine kinase